jgi:hypothetical protein
MIERKKHLREVIETKSMQIRARESLIEDQRKEIHEWQKENEVLHQENKELRFDNEELRELFSKVKKLAESNNYGNEKSILNKIKELVSDFENNY